MKMDFDLDKMSCMYGPNETGFHFYPKDSLWTMKSVYDIMLKCDENEVLAGVYPDPICEGGFAWDGTVESSLEWNRNIRNKEYDHSIIEDREIRTYGVSSFWVTDPKNWREWMPQDPNFNKPMSIDNGSRYSKGNREINAIHCACKCNPTIRMCIELMKIIKNQGHTILSTNGFKVVNDHITITPGKDNKMATAGVIADLKRY